MEPLEDRELTDKELDGLLCQWKTPPPPPGLRAAIFGVPAASWWRRIWTASIRVPAPVAACLLILLALGAWLWVKQPSGNSPPPREAQLVGFRELRPVSEFRPRIIRRHHAEN